MSRSQVFVDGESCLELRCSNDRNALHGQAEKAKPTSPRNHNRKRGQRLIPEDAPREERVYKLPEEERLCPHDGQPMPFIRWEESKQLDYVPPQPIEKGLAGPGLLAQMVVGKFRDHLPGYRLEDILSRHGVEIRRSTIYDWLASVAELVTPLVERMKQRILQSNVIHTDDTQVKLIIEKESVSYLFIMRFYEPADKFALREV